MSTTERNGFRYTALFCEENIWWLAKALIDQGIAANDIDIVFISNKTQQVAVFEQQSAEISHPVIWDYHVILIQHSDRPLVYDFDSNLAFPCSLTQYLEKSFHQQKHIHPEYRAQFRLVETAFFIASFSSDRSHMIGVIHNNEFPSYAVIGPDKPDKAVQLQSFIDFNQPVSNSELIHSVSALLKYYHLSNS